MRISVDELHAAIAAHLRRTNRRLLTACPPPVPLSALRCRA